MSKSNGNDKQPSAATVTRHGAQFVKDFSTAIEAGEAATKRGAELRDHARWALDTLGDVEGIAFLQTYLAEAQGAYITAHPRPAGASDSPAAIAWRNAFANPLRAVKTELDERKTAKILAASWKAGSEGITVRERQAGGKAATPLEKAVKAIGNLEGKGQKDCAEVMAAVVAHFGISRVNKAVAG